MAKKSTGRAYSKAQVEKQRRARGNAIRRAIFVVAVLAVVVLAVVFLVLRGGEGASVGENAIGSAFSPLQNAFSLSLIHILYVGAAHRRRPRP